MSKKSSSKPRHTKMFTKRLADIKLALKLNIYDHKPKYYPMDLSYVKVADALPRDKKILGIT
jgi:hypothetical protein